MQHWNAEDSVHKKMKNGRNRQQFSKMKVYILAYLFFLSIILLSFLVDGDVSMYTYVLETLDLSGGVCVLLYPLPATLIYTLSTSRCITKQFYRGAGFSSTMTSQAAGLCIVNWRSLILLSFSESYCLVYMRPLRGSAWLTKFQKYKGKDGEVGLLTTVVVEPWRIDELLQSHELRNRRAGCLS
ncbi:hypothetical protein TRIUR3_34795 [Triticum urartu]|uniref:Uncharacterized protein n=1 Tax=Triticum urartu TaxID=4572 RepID=M7YSL6_TRIUA|nr:hypothetical protein TRIUR3_34795 [Triticum urartu]